TAAQIPGGVFSTTLDLVPEAGVEYSIYTMRAHGADDRSQDTETPINVEVSDADAVATSTMLTADPAGGIVEGESVTLTASVTPATATGWVQFRAGSTVLGTTPVAGGTAGLSVDS